jgi:hypothetical protein
VCILQVVPVVSLCKEDTAQEAVDESHVNTGPPLNELADSMIRDGSNLQSMDSRGAIHQCLRMILNLRILVLLPVSTLFYVVRVKNSS